MKAKDLVHYLHSAGCGNPAPYTIMGVEREFGNEATNEKYIGNQ